MVRSRAEERLLSFLRREPDGTGIAEAGEPSAADWDDLLLQSDRHHVAPLLYHRLATSRPDVPIPAEVLRALRNIYLKTAGGNLHLYHELGKVLGRLRRDDIPVIALKGAHLAIDVYRNVALRPMSDADLLVHRSDLPGVREALVELGFAASREEIFSSHEQLPQYRKRNSIVVEVHFNIAEPPFSRRVDVEKLFTRARTCSIEGGGVLSLCPEDLLLHLCMHASYHHGFDNGILPLFDIDTVIERYKGDLDWERVFRRSTEWGVEKCVDLTFALAEKIAGASIPDRSTVDKDVRRIDSKAEGVAEELLFGKGTRIVPNMARLFDDSGYRYKVIHFMRRAFPPKNMMSRMNPGDRDPISFYLLYYYRIKGLIRRHGRTAWKLFLGDDEMSACAGLENRRNMLKDWLAN